MVEFGSARNQEIIDRFVGGEEIPYDSLRRVWQDATMPHGANDYPINEEFFRAVRTLNATLPRERRLRVLLGEPPIDWDAIRTRGRPFQVARDARRVSCVADSARGPREAEARARPLWEPALSATKRAQQLRHGGLARAIAGPPVEADNLKKYCAGVAPKKE